MMSFVLCSKIKSIKALPIFQSLQHLLLAEHSPWPCLTLLSVTLLWLHNCFKDRAKAGSNVFYLRYAFSKFIVKIKGIGKTLGELGELTGESFR